MYSISRPQPLQAYSTWPARQKRSKVIARLVYNH
jgi:hypothetical protein